MNQNVLKRVVAWGIGGALVLGLIVNVLSVSAQSGSSVGGSSVGGSASKPVATTTRPVARPPVRTPATPTPTTPTSTPTYPGFYMTLDKSRYTPTETLVLSIRRADFGTASIALDLEILPPSLNRIPIKKISVGASTTIQVNLSQYNLVAADYMLRVVAAGQTPNPGKNTNSVPFTIATTTIKSPDVNRDGIINWWDIQDFADCLMNCSQVESEMDLNSDGRLNALDLAILRAAYNKANPTLIGETNGDGKVEWRDILEFAECLNHCAYYNGVIDFNSDGRINALDLEILRANYNSENPTLIGETNGDGFVTWRDIREFAECFVHCSYYNANFDFDSSGRIDPRDLSILRTSYNNNNPKLIGESNGDDKIDWRDILEFAECFNHCTYYNAMFDFDSNGKIDPKDLAIVRASYNAANPNLIGEQNGDGVVNWRDIREFGKCFADCQEYNANADLNADGRIDPRDLAIIRTSHNAANPTLVAEVNGDGVINQRDLDDLTAMIDGEKYFAEGDLNSDGKVDKLDLDIVNKVLNPNSRTPYRPTTPTGTSTRGRVRGATTVATCTVVTQPLQIGATDESSNGEVTKLQNFLETQGFSFITKGTFGLRTENALLSWQTTNGLVATGAVGPATQEAMNAISCH
jgi:hypothetical protein